MIDRDNFIEKYNIDEEKLDSSNISWDNLVNIYDKYTKEKEDFELAGIVIFELLQEQEKVHSIKYRIKNPEHLIEKIIRKKIKDPELEITEDNYKEIITDIIGVRVLHLFKEDWTTIHNYIKDTWELIENPEANIREGDSKELIEEFENNGCEIVEHPYGYRSIHYLVKSQPTKISYVTEIQVRTIFEEGWSEIDHELRYPYNVDNPIIAQFLIIFNRLAGSADEIGSFIKYLRDELEQRAKLISSLKEKIDELEIENEQKRGIQIDLDKINEDIFQLVNAPNLSDLGISFNPESITATIPKVKVSPSPQEIFWNQSIRLSKKTEKTKNANDDSEKNTDSN